MAVTKIEPISGIAAELGESPVWSAEEGAVYWIDILGHVLHRTRYPGGETDTWQLPGPPGMIALRRLGGLVVALDDGLYGFDRTTGALKHLVAIEADIPDNRANDGKCDAAGRLWVGTMNRRDGSVPSGRFYCVEPDLSVREIATGYRIPNGLAWSPDERTLYHTDTRSGLVTAHDFDPRTGERGPARPFFAFDRTDRMITGLRNVGLDLERSQFPIVTENHLVQWEMCKGGLGICIVMEQVGDAEPLVRRLLPEIALPVPVWLTSHRELRTSRRIRVVFDLLAEELGR